MRIRIQDLFDPGFWIRDGIIGIRDSESGINIPGSATLLKLV
jgi:hypothetical protein